ncbi:Importin subunit alpha-1, partial [Coemansia sp. RSA 2603]
MERASDNRRNAYKTKGTFQPDEARRRREEQGVEIRRQKRDEMVFKKRNFNLPQGNDSDSEDEAERAAATQDQLQEQLP